MNPTTRLERAGLPDLAAALERISEQRRAGPSVLVISPDPARNARHAESLSAVAATITTQVVDGPVDPRDEHLLATDLLVWATPATAPLPKHERDLLASLDASGLPTVRAAMLADAALLARVSDDPETEAADVRARLAGLLPEGWAVLTDAEAVGTHLAAIDRAAADPRIGEALLRLGRERVAVSTAELDARIAALQERLEEEEAAVETIRSGVSRAAARLLAVARRHGDALVVDLHRFVEELQEALPAELQAMADARQTRTALPGWLQHVVETFLGERLADAHAAILSDLEGAELGEEDLREAVMVLPAFDPELIDDDGDWRAKVAATGAVGGGAALLWYGAWLPGVIALTAGIAWTSVLRRTQADPSLDELVRDARGILRDLLRQADEAVQAHLANLEAHLGALAGQKADAASQASEALRTAWQVEREDLDGQRHLLVARTQLLTVEGAPS